MTRATDEDSGGVLADHQVGTRPTLPIDQVIAEFGFHYFNDVRSWQHTWLGRPVHQNPHDIWAIQEIMWQTKPEVIVETGTQNGGSCILWRWLLEACSGGGGDVITIDVDHTTVIERDPAIHYLTGSSVDPNIIAQVRETVGGRPTLVILDSDHSPTHVAGELDAYAPLVPVGGYLIVQDTFIGGHPVDVMAWDGGPWPTVQRFIAEHPEWVIDERIEPMHTFCTDGYLRRLAPSA